MFLLKYQPKSVDEILGNRKEAEIIKKWFINWFRGKASKPILITGPTGCGKTATVLALAKQYHLDLIEMNSGDFRNSENIKRKLSTSSLTRSLYGNAKIILIDDIDTFTKEDRGGISEIVKLLKSSKIPIILTAIDIWDKKLAPIRSLCTVVKYKKVSKRTLLPLLKYINSKERLGLSDEILEEIAENANGDIRAAINDLEKHSYSVRNIEVSIFERMRLIFKSETYKEARSASWNFDHDLLKLWIEENIPYAYKLPCDLKRAYEYLSFSDIFDGYIRKRQNWSFLRYSSDLLTAGVALAKSKKYFHYVNFVYPTYIRQMSLTSTKRHMLKSIGKKIGVKLHMNWKESIQIIDLIKHFLEKDMDVARYYEFSDEELAFILSKSVMEIKHLFKKTKPIKKSAPKKDKKSEEKVNKKHVKKVGLTDFL